LTMSLGLEHYLILSAILFSIGLYGALAKRNAVVVLMCIEIMLNAVNIAMVAFSRYLVPDVVVLTGHVFAIFIMTVAAAEAAVGLAIIITIYRNRHTVDIEQTDLMQG
jgi:NAD(P)H-quinone oxidoreductase subunit 4L